MHQKETLCGHTGRPYQHCCQVSNTSGAHRGKPALKARAFNKCDGPTSCQCKKNTFKNLQSNGWTILDSTMMIEHVRTTLSAKVHVGGHSLVRQTSRPTSSCGEPDTGEPKQSHFERLSRGRLSLQVGGEPGLKAEW